MDEHEPIWRQALHDEQHPLNRAAWHLFSPSMNAAYSAQTLAAQKDEVIALINLILDADELYDVDSLGKGVAPVNAVTLLGEWQVVEAIPRLIFFFETEDIDSAVYEAALTSLEKMGTAAVEPLLELAARQIDPDDNVIVASILSIAGKGDPRALEFIKKVFDQQTTEHAILFMAESLLAVDSEAGIPYIEDKIRRRRYTKEARNRLEKYIRDTRAGKM